MPNMKRYAQCAVAMIAALALAALPACGGGGNGYGGPQADLAVSNAVLPQIESGQTVDHELPIAGGCGGPYVVSVIEGALPDGLTIENRQVPDGNGGTRNAVYITGIALEAGPYSARVQISDTECTPFQTIVQLVEGTIVVGDLAIVAASPDLIPEGQFDDIAKFTAGAGEPGIDAIATTTYNQFTVVNLVVAGGTGPYFCQIIDDPNDPDDGALPLGVALIEPSCSIVGAPVQVKAGGVPFKFTIEARDSVGNTTTRKVQWKIATPPINIATPGMGDGTAGQNYTESLQIVDGVPPFNWELINQAGEEDFEQHTYASPAVPTFPTTPGVTVSNTGTSVNRISVADYPATTDNGPNYTPAPSEGIYMIGTGASAGSITGTPRRVGSFTINTHAWSVLVPNERGQHGFKTYTFAIDEPASPATMSSAFTAEGTGAIPTSAPFYTVPEFQVSAAYNPDQAAHSPNGLQLTAVDGVPFDGFSDAPHEAARFANNETIGDYRWSATFYSDTAGAMVTNPSPIAMLESKIDGQGSPYNSGLLGVPVGTENTLQRSSRAVMDISLVGEILPDSLKVPVTNRFNWSVGPDKVIITESTTSSGVTLSTARAAFDMADGSLEVRKMQIVNGAAVISDLDAGDLSPTHVLPADVAGGLTNNTALGELLSDRTNEAIDIMRITTNPSTRRDDNNNLNANTAQGGQGADPQKSGWHDSNGADNSEDGWQPNAMHARMANAPGVAHDPAAGVYNNGGRLYAFESSSYMGLFMIRSDASIYVPFAIEKGTYNSMGDNHGFAQGNLVDTGSRTIQLCTSPDGRFGAIELHTASASSSSVATTATGSRIAIFSLTGEKVFGGATYRLMEPGAAAVSFSGNEYVRSSTMVMTNEYIYYIIGHDTDFSSTSYSSWRNHFVMRGDILSGSGALAPGSGTNWTQDSITPMQTPCHNFLQGTAKYRVSQFGGGRQPDAYLYDASNWAENSQAPIPFRVSTNGETIALLAGPMSASQFSGSDTMRHYAWVDHDGSGFVQATTSTANRYVPMGATRGYGLSRGPRFMHWGNYTGPGTHFEISDDGNRVAYAFYASSGSTTSTTSTSRFASPQEEIVVCSTTDNWASSTETQVTTLFTGAQIWSFGGLIFTADNDALVFWGGFAVYDPDSSSTTYQRAGGIQGTYYAYDLVNDELKSCFATADGGNEDGITTYTAASTVTLPNTTGWDGAPGDHTPVSGFISKDRSFFYFAGKNASGVGSTPSGTNRQTANLLFGINIAAYENATENGHDACEGFIVPGQLSRYGFHGSYFYYNYYGLNLRTLIPGREGGMGTSVMAKDTGYVYYRSQYQGFGPGSTTSSSLGISVATYYMSSTYVMAGGRVFGFNPDVGGTVYEITPSSFGVATNTSPRYIHNVDTNDDGSVVSYVFDTSTGRYYSDWSTERIGLAWDLGFDATTGDINPAFSRDDTSIVLEDTNGRAGTAMAFGSQGLRLFYGYKASSANENDKELVEMVRTGNTVVKTGYGAARRYNVLFAGR